MKYLKFLLLTSLWACVAPPEAGYAWQNHLLQPTEPVELVEAYIDSDTFCAILGEDLTIYSTSGTDHLDYKVLDIDTIDIQWVGRATFTETPDGYNIWFHNLLINRTVPFTTCYKLPDTGE
jgi:hypothetical protein